MDKTEIWKKYCNPLINDNELLIIDDNLTIEYTNLLKKIGSIIKINRPKVEYVVSFIDFIETNNDFIIYCKIVDYLIKIELNDEPYIIFLLCYCRTKWFNVYENNIDYINPKYNLTMDKNNKWLIFLEGFSKKKSM